MFGHNSDQATDGSQQPQGDMPHEPMADATLTHPSDDHQMGNDINMPAPEVPADPVGGYIMTDTPAPSAPAAPSEPVVSPTTTPTPADSDLLALKQQALQQLSPLVDHLEQTPEEKFRTTMMMIQASDNHALIKVAYEAAQQIVDEKIRAQALLDIVNEINYFTQHQD